MNICSIIQNNRREIIVLSSFGAAIWQGFVARKHYRLTVKPHLIPTYIIDKDERNLDLLLQQSSETLSHRFMTEFDKR